MPDCPCGSGKTYADCCGAYIDGRARPPTAEALMRSRYSAYVMKEIDYLVRTTAPAERTDGSGSREWAEKADWQGFELIRTEGGREDDRAGTVEFVARYTMDGVEHQHHEISRFRKIEGRWYFQRGKVVGPPPIVNTEKKPEPNDPCPCGSGRKYKKCCGR